MKILQINTGLNGQNSNSTKIANAISEKINASIITIRDLNENPINHLTSEEVAGFYNTEDKRTTNQKELLQQSDELISEINNHDIIVIGVPMYNFGIPSTLKAWIDQIARVGVTFQYGDNGSEGLITGKKVYIAVARGGHYQGNGMDVQTEYLKMVLNFIGLSDINFIYGEGFAINEESAYKSAIEQINEKIKD